MLTTELLFLVGFVVFIAAILVLDMLVIDRKAHVVSIKEAGTWTAVWIVLALAFAIFLYFHGDMVHGIQNFNDLQAVSTRYASHLKLNPDDFEASLQQYRHYMTISYISGYLIEKTLSVDNLFVMMMIFASFGIDKKEYQHALNWGILGAIVLRFVFIFAGAALISRFEWILLVFGVFLLYSGVKMFLDRNKKEEINAMNHPVVRFLNKHFHLTPLVLTVIFILRDTRPLRGVLLQHLRHTRIACPLLPARRHSRQVPLSEGRRERVAGVHRCEDARTRIHRDWSHQLARIHSPCACRKYMCLDIHQTSHY